MTSIRHLGAPTRRPRPAADRAARATLLAAASRIRFGTLVVDDEAGRHHVAGSTPPEVHVRVTDPRAWSHTLLHASRGLGEAYVRGWWDCDDLAALLRVVLRNVRPLLRRLDRAGEIAAPATDPFRRLVARGNRLGRDRANVQAHYDLSNEFFALFLDETMTYSCAVFDPPSLDLADAQREKLDRICRMLDLGPDDQVVEIGTGWGSFAIHAASRYGCRVTTTTISAAQQDLAVKRVSEAGLAHLVTVRPDDYRLLRGRYSKLVSIEMIEAVDWRDHAAFFRSCGHLLADGGLMALQAIVIEDGAFHRSKSGQDFLRRFIFPGGCLPSVESIVHAASRHGGLRVISLDDIGAHYPATLRSWRSRFDANREQVGALGLDEQFQRLWRLYLCYCEAAFLEHRVSDVQVLLAKAGATVGAG